MKFLDIKEFSRSRCSQLHGGIDYANKKDKLIFS